ncbi:MAG: hypothetical protein EPN39_00320 [Chitinophagaceae bacterium]|nr:MAG: hypothetical protein EPN39_00320 [Chitinophagaceae bacterium]
MFKIFKRRKDNPALTFGVMQYISEAVERGQRKIAGYLNGKTKGFSKKKWMLSLCGFCLMFGGVSFIIFCNSIENEQPQRENKFYPQSITIPSSVLQQDRAWDSLKILEEIYTHRNDNAIKIKEDSVNNIHNH